MYLNKIDIIIKKLKKNETWLSITIKNQLRITLNEKIKHDYL